MKLENVHIKNFRCIDDSNSFSIGQTTCLVGKNESGKTSILQALTKLNSADNHFSHFDRERDYPRRLLTDFSQNTQALETNWSLEDEDLVAITMILGPDALPEKSVTITRGYEADNLNRWNFRLDEQKIIDWLLHEAGCDADERMQLETTGNIKEFVKKAEPLKANSPRIATMFEKMAKWRNGNPVLAVIDILTPRVPKFLYFASYDRMDGNVSLEKLKTDVANGRVSRNDSVFLAFLDFAGTTLEELSKLDRYESMKARVESASIKISKQIFKYWSQNRHLKVQFSMEAGRAGDAPPFNVGNVIRTRILNMHHEMTVPFDDRSAGFVWFFSFLVLFSQVKRKYGNVIILLDEPGLNLHAKAQADLLRFINEELKPYHQVIYTTHSPFMVGSDNLANVRTVEDVIKYGPDGVVEAVLGTKVGSKVLSSDRDTLFPLQGALGYEITQNLFVGKDTLVVENPSDILYLKAASVELGRRGRTRLDPRWTLCPVGSIDKVAAFMSLFTGNKLHVAVLMDQVGRNGKVESLTRSQMLQDGHVFTMADFCAQPEAGLEDFLGPDLYVDLVNNTYNLFTNGVLNATDIQALPERSPRIVKKIQAAFKAKPSHYEFDAHTPAMWLLQNPTWLNKETPNVTAALDRFENLFKKLNALL